MTHLSGVHGYDHSCREGLPWDPVVKNLPTHAGNVGFNPWSWKIPQASELLSLCAAIAEATL